MMTPALLGYRWPAEWEPHQATWLAWPHKSDSWPGHFDPVRPQMAKFVRAIADFEPVHLLAGGDTVMHSARMWVGDHPHVTLHDISTDDAWCRDYGPIFLQSTADTPPALIDWQYDAWGGKYPPFDQDNAVPQRIAKLTGYQRFVSEMVLEGGSIEGNGAGLLLTTEQCLLNSNRNPGQDRQQLERMLHDYLGVQQVIWLIGGEMAGDDTDGHIDQLARFVDPETVVVAVEDDPNDENYGPLQQNYVFLQTATDLRGRHLKVVPLPMPRAKFQCGQRLPASYCNFYLANGVCAVPQFDDPADQEAVEILKNLLPDRKVLGLPALDLVFGLGAFHCLSQQQPRSKQSEPRLDHPKRAARDGTSPCPQEPQLQ
jgi:agmatine deiminase